MINKTLAIVWKDVYTTFTDRNLLLIMIAIPLLIASLVGVVFGDIGSNGGSAFRDIPVAIVNLDEGYEDQGGAVNYGSIFTSVLGGDTGADAETNDSGGQFCNFQSTGDESQQPTITLNELIAAENMESIEAARTGVDDGDYVAAIIIPADFSEKISPAIGPGAGVEPTSIEVYANSAQPITASIVRSVADGFTNQLLTCNIAIAASINTLISDAPLLAARMQGQDTQTLLVSASNSAAPKISINQLPVNSDDDRNDLSATSIILIQIGAAQAAFFALFTGQFGVLSIVEERRLGTLQRMLVAPINRIAILVGKIGGTFTIVIFQLVALIIALTLIASLIEGGLLFIWGSNIIGIVAVVLALSMAVCGFAILLAGLAKTPEQAGTFGSLLNIMMAIAGGAFGAGLPSPFREMSLIYWAVDAFNKLASGSSDIVLNLVVLVVQGVVLFTIGAYLFNRRVDF